MIKKNLNYKSSILCWEGNNTIGVQKALLELGNYLKNINYQFITITPESHKFVLSRMSTQREVKGTSDRILRDFFGWNIPVLKKISPHQFYHFLCKPTLRFTQMIYI